MPFIIRRTDHDKARAWVGPAGGRKAYVHRKDKARRFDTRAQAEADRCVENEVIEEVCC